MKERQRETRDFLKKTKMSAAVTAGLTLGEAGSFVAGRVTDDFFLSLYSLVALTPVFLFGCGITLELYEKTISERPYLKSKLSGQVRKLIHQAEKNIKF